MFKTKSITYFNCYTLTEVGNLVHRSEKTVREFIKDGLNTIDKKRPFLIRGYDLIEFLKHKNLQNQHLTNIDEMFCLKCREVRNPKSKQIKIMDDNIHFLRASAQCPVCSTIMNKPYKIDQLSELKRIFHIVDKLSIHDSSVSPVNYQSNNTVKGTSSGNEKNEQLCMTI